MTLHPLDAVLSIWNRPLLTRILITLFHPLVSNNDRQHPMLPFSVTLVCQAELPGSHLALSEHTWFSHNLFLGEGGAGENRSGYQDFCLVFFFSFLFFLNHPVSKCANSHKCNNPFGFHIRFSQLGYQILCLIIVQLNPLV